jgi:hypothetical protein
MDEQAPQPAQPARRMTASRIVLLILLAVAAGAFVVDLIARRSATAAKAALDDALDEARRHRDDAAYAAPTRSEVHKLLKREPDPDNPRPNIEIYTWQGALQQYRVWVRYGPGETETVVEVALNQPLQ